MHRLYPTLGSGGGYLSPSALPRCAAPCTDASPFVPPLSQTVSYDDSWRKGLGSVGLFVEDGENANKNILVKRVPSHSPPYFHTPLL